MRKLILGIVLGMMASQVSAANWVEIRANTEVVVSIDTTSVATTGKYRSAWFRFRYLNPSSNANATYGLALFYFNCSERTEAVKAASNYSETGIELASATVNSDQLQFEAIRPESLADTQSRYLCK